MALYSFNQYINRYYSYLSLKPIDDAICIEHENVEIEIEDDKIYEVFDFLRVMCRIIYNQNTWCTNVSSVDEALTLQSDAVYEHMLAITRISISVDITIAFLPFIARCTAYYYELNPIDQFIVKDVFLWRLITESLFHFCIEKNNLLDDRRSFVLDIMRENNVVNSVIWSENVFKISDNVFKFQYLN